MQFGCLLHDHCSSSFCAFTSFIQTVIGEHFEYGTQEDAHEFLRCILDAMQKSCTPKDTSVISYPKAKEKHHNLTVEILKLVIELQQFNEN